MNKTNGFITAGFWSVLGTFLVKGTYLVTIPLYSRLLSVEEYGDVNIFITYAGILTILLSGNLVAAVSPGCVKFKEKKDFLASVMTLSLLLLGGFFLLLALFGDLWVKLLELTKLQIFLLFLYSFGQYVLSFNSSRLIMEYRYKENTVISFLTLLADTFLSIVLILTICKHNRFDGRIWGAAIPTTIAGGAISYVLLQAGRDWFNREYWKFATTLSFPMIFHGLAHIVLGQSDRLMIRRMVGAREAGIYSLIYNIAVMLAALVTALNHVWIPWMFRRLGEHDEKEIRVQANRYIFWFFAVTFTLLTFSAEVIKILAAQKYWEGISLMIPIVLSSFFTFLYTLYVNVEIFSEKTRGIAVGTCAAALINIVLNYLLLPLLGYQVAAYTTVFSYLLLLVFHYFIYHRIWPKQVYNDKIIFLTVLTSSFYGIVIYVTLPYLWIRVVFFLVFAFIVILKRPPLPELDISLGGK